MAPTIQPIAVELSFSLNPGPNLPPIQGRIDLLAKGEGDWKDGDAPNVHDTKTSSKAWNQARADSDLQFTIYNEAVAAHYGQRPRRCVVDVLTKGKVAAYKPISTTRTLADWTVLRHRIQVMVDMVKAGIFPPAEPGSWVCSPKWCGYWHTCKHVPAYRK
jgi:hypothetical protein